MSKDGEGNRYSPFSGTSTGRYVASSTWSGQYYGEDDDEELDEYRGDDVIDVICLWPVN
jgi:hypothetical protein